MQFSEHHTVGASETMPPDQRWVQRQLLSCLTLKLYFTENKWIVCNSLNKYSWQQEIVKLTFLNLESI